MAADNVKQGEFDLAHDLDFFRVDLTSGQRYLFNLKGAGSNPIGSQELLLFNAQGVLQVLDFDSGPLGQATLSFVSPTTDPYYLLTTNSDLESFGTASFFGGYQISAAIVALDDHSDLKESGTPLAVGTSKSGAFDLPHDFDYFRVDLLAGQRYQFDMKGAGVDPLDSMEMQLIGSNGEQIEFDVGSGAGAKAQISFVPATSSTYFLLASNNDFSKFGFDDGIGSYQIGLSSVALDDHSDLPGNATQMLMDTSKAGTFDLPDDLDYFKISLQAGQRYLIDLNWLGLGTVSSTEMQLFDPTGTLQVSDTRLPGESLSEMSYRATSSGTFLLRASNTSVIDTGGAAAIGNYQVRIAPVSQDSEPDLVSEAQTLTLGAVKAGSFDLPHDLDYFHVPLVAGQRYRFEMTGAGTKPLATTVLQLLSPDGSLALSDTGLTAAGGAAMSFVAPATGTYNLLATNDDLDLMGVAAAIGSYEIRATQIALDDHSDSTGNATVLNLNSVASGKQDQPYDLDYFRVELVGEQRYLFELNGSGATPLHAPGFELYSGNGVLQGADYQGLGDSHAALAFVPRSSGTYYVLVSNAGLDDLGPAATTGNYDLRFTQVARDDHSDIASQGTLIKPEALALPGIILNGTAGSDTLVGTEGNDELHGAAGRDRLTGAAGNDLIDGGTDLDTALFAGPRSSHALARTASGWTVVDTAGTDGTDTLTGVERLAFGNHVNVALDLDGNAGITAKILGAVFGKSYLQTKEFVGIGLDLLDGGMIYQDVVALALRTDLFALLAGSRSNTDFVRLVYTNVIGVAPGPAELGYFVGLLNSGTYTQASLAYLACETLENAQHIDLVGLASTGIDYVPVG